MMGSPKAATLRDFENPKGFRKRWQIDWSTREGLVPFLFLAPSILALALVSLYPMAHAVFISFHADGIGAVGRFVGLEQYQRIFSSDYFPRVLRISLLWTVGNVIFVWALGLATALMLDRNFPGRPLVRAMFILPWAMPYVAAGLIWGWMFDYEFGVLNFLVQSTGLSASKVNFLLACPDALASLTAVSVWKLFPLGTVMFLAGLQTIPVDQYEAARVDGAGPVQCFWYVTLPGLRNVTTMLTLLITIWTFGRAFTIIFLLTEGGPAGCTETIVVRSYLEAFKFFHLGTASAIGVIVLLISLAFSVGYLAYVYRSEAGHG
jgi:multiple sugar transport system permease protein